MTEPLVCGIMLTADRPAMTARAIRSFEAQTYPRKILLVLDSGHQKLNLRNGTRLIYATVDARSATEILGKNTEVTSHVGPLTHGELCNLANGMTEGADILAHFDSDDWSHPRRLDEQVAELTATRNMYRVSQGRNDPVECVGYNDMLFWDSTSGEAWFYTHPGKHYAVGASHCYWRSAWEREKFKPLLRGADTEWLRRVRCVGSTCSQIQGPMMICEIHGGNVSSRIRDGHEQWKRVPEWDDYCRARMTLCQ